MGVTGIAANTLIRDKKSALKRGKTYVYDAMNILYSMCSISAISDILGQKPAVPTRNIVSRRLLVAFFVPGSPFLFFIHRFLLTSTNGAKRTVLTEQKQALNQFF